MKFVIAFAFAGSPRVVPDRPDVANGTFTVDPRAAQIELGLALPATERPPVAALASVVRIGLNRRAELRVFEGEPAAWIAGTGGASMSFGAKVRVHDGDEARKVPSLALMPIVATHGVTRGVRPSVGLVALAGVALSRRLTLDINAAASTAVAERPLVEGLAAASLAVGLTASWIAYVEAYSDLHTPPRGASVGADAGTIVILGPRFAVDAAAFVESGEGSAPTVVTTIGISVRLGRP